MSAVGERAGALPDSIDATSAALRAQGYVAQRQLATALFLALSLERPLFLEGEPGTGKTELAKTVAHMLGRPLLRLQCYEGLDINAAAYEWNYALQMMEIRLSERADQAAVTAGDLFGERFLIARPLLQAIDPRQPVPPVLLIDELDRADEPFEALLLELLSDFQITIPEYGAIRAIHHPIVVVTSNRTREIHDAVKRRCIYHWLEMPDAAREIEILRSRVPEASSRLTSQSVAFVQRLRALDLFKAPGIAETIDWVRALGCLGVLDLDARSVSDTLGVLLKYEDDLRLVDGERLAGLVRGAAGAMS